MTTTMYNCHNCAHGQLLGVMGSKCMLCGHVVCAQCKKLKALSQSLLDMHISDPDTVAKQKKGVNTPQPFVQDIHVNKLGGNPTRDAAGPKTAVSRMKVDELQIQRGMLLDMHVNGIEEPAGTKVVKAVVMARRGGSVGRHGAFGFSMMMAH